MERLYTLCGYCGKEVIGVPCVPCECDGDAVSTALRIIKKCMDLENMESENDLLWSFRVAHRLRARLPGLNAYELGANIARSVELVRTRNAGSVVGKGK